MAKKVRRDGAPFREGHHRADLPAAKISDEFWRPLWFSKSPRQVNSAGGEIADVLGLPAKEVAARSPLGLISRIEHGLPVAALDRVAHLLAPGNAKFKYRLVPKATYDRRKSEPRLSSEEGTRVAHVARVWSLAREIRGGDEDARDFLFRAHPMIEDKRPIDVVVQNEFGAEMVIEILGRLKYGSAA